MATNWLAVKKDTTWVYQVSQMSEIALYTLVHDELKTTYTIAHVAVNPYLILLDTLTNASTYKTLEDQKVLSDGCYHLGISRRYSVFDAVTACITVQAEEKQSRVEVDKLVQVIVRIAAQTLQGAAREEEARGRDAGLLSQFAKKLLLTPSAVTCPLTS
uniref:Uncharacterized protein n=1 Tax=Peronospora matthiolae TaxID=2874970 RepID=A0AAV1UJ35_9STRA